MNVLNKLVRFLSVAAVLASTLTLQGCLESEQEKATQAEQQKGDAYQKALNQRQCEFIGMKATSTGQCVEKR